MDTGSIFGGNRAGAWQWTTHHFIAPASSMGRPILLSPFCACLARSGTALHLTCKSSTGAKFEVGLNFEVWSCKVSDGYKVAGKAPTRWSYPPWSGRLQSCGLFSARATDLFLLQSLRSCCGAHPTFYLMVDEALYPRGGGGVKRLRRKFGHLFPFCEECKNK
jgi:hypothetical protein